MDERIRELINERINFNYLKHKTSQTNVLEANDVISTNSTTETKNFHLRLSVIPLLQQHASIKGIS